MLNKIGSFQRNIYEILKRDNYLSEALRGIYINIQRDASYPYILINMLKLGNLSLGERYSYEIEFEILLFTKDKNQEKILTKADHIINLISPNMAFNEEYRIIALKFIDIEWRRGNDPLLTKISLKYKGLIMGEKNE